jgi:hypothetical protein
MPGMAWVTPTRTSRLSSVIHGWPDGPLLCQRRHVLVAAYLLLVMAATAATDASETDTGTLPVEVLFDGPEGCSGANAFFTSLRSRTDHVRQADAAEPRTTLQVRLSREHGHVVGELRTIDSSGETDTRRVQGATCDDVVQALSLTAALALAPTDVLSVPAAVPRTDAAAIGVPAKAVLTAEKQPAPAEVVPAQTPSAPVPRPVPSIELGAGLLGLAVLSGSFSPGIGLAVRKTLGRDGAFRPTLGLALAYARNDVWQSPQGAQVALVGMAATMCPLRWTASILKVQPCALGLAGRMTATGRQVTHVSTVDRFWLSAGLTVRMAAFLGRGFSLELEGGITAPLLKRRFFATVPSHVVAETPVISPLVGLGLTYAR